MVRLLIVLALVQAPQSEEVPELLKRWMTPQTWERDTEGPVLTRGSEKDFDAMHVLSPCVAREMDRYLMWYSGGTGLQRERAYALGFAEGPDGKTFGKLPGNPVMRLADGKRSILTPATLREPDGTLIREKGKIRLWFSIADFSKGTTPYPVHTLHTAWSEDGRTWSEPSAPLLENCYAPSILKEGDRYTLWYADLGRKSWAVRHAVSPDGISWKVTDEPVLQVDQKWERGNLFYPAVVKVDRVYLMWYGSYWSEHENKTALGAAASLDGLKWHKNPHNPVFRPDEKRSWESHYTTSETVVRLPDGSWRIWYAGRTKPPHVNLYFALNTARWSGPK